MPLLDLSTQHRWVAIVYEHEGAASLQVPDHRQNGL